MLREELRDQLIGEDPDTDFQTLAKKINSKINQPDILITSEPYWNHTE